MSLTLRAAQTTLLWSLLAVCACDSKSEISHDGGSRSGPQEDAGRAAEAGSAREASIPTDSQVDTPTDSSLDECATECIALARLYVESLSVPGKAPTAAPVCTIYLEGNLDYCDCFGAGGSSHQECVAVSPRTGFCLSEGGPEGCTKTSCAETCRQPIERLIEESATTYDAQILQTSCTVEDPQGPPATCRAAIEIDGNCHDMFLEGSSKQGEVHARPPVEASCKDVLCPLRQKCTVVTGLLSPPSPPSGF